MNQTHNRTSVLLAVNDDCCVEVWSGTTRARFLGERATEFAALMLAESFRLT